jgi:hypothetical protein
MHHPGEPRGRDPKWQLHAPAEHLARRVDGRDVTQDRWMELNVRERLPRPRQGDFAVRAAVSVVERRAGSTPLRDPTQVPDGQRLR